MKKLIYLLPILLISMCSFAQDDLESLLDDETTDEKSFVTATFKNTRVLNGHSIEMMKPNELEFRISHRFGELNSGAYELWGLDQAHIHLSFEYGINDRITVGVGRGTYQKTYDGFAKFKLLRQATGSWSSPVSVVYVTSIAINSLKDEVLQDYFSNRLAYAHGLLIARKFSSKLSLQLSPHLVHRNFVETSVDQNDLFAVGVGGRYKLTKRISVNAEYFYVVEPSWSVPSTEIINPLSIGLDIETGGHVFQLHITNSLAMIEKGFIGETRGDWLDGGIHFGFNVSRVFSL